MPDANIGIATGKESNLVILDVDGADGKALLAELERTHGPIGETITVLTGNGQHLYLSYPKNISKVSSVARDCLDVRADGGYIVAPLSKHESGHIYAFDNLEAQLAECPQWLVMYANAKLKGETRRLAITDGGPVKISKAGRPSHILPPSSAPPIYSEAEEARLRSALALVPADDRTVWRDAGMGLHWTGWVDKAFCIWDDWSRTCPEKYDEADQDNTWASFDREYEGPRITIATIFHLAKQFGWPGQTSSRDSPSNDFRTGLGNAKLFVKRHGENIRYIYHWQRWMSYRRILVTCGIRRQLFETAI
jgi:hypothetical protein